MTLLCVLPLQTLHLSYYVETDLGDGFTGFASSKNVVHTPFGPGSIVETRPNGSVVVDLLFGRAFLQEDAIISRQEGPLQADTIHQLHRVNLVRSMVRSNNFGADDAEEVKESKGVDEPSYDDEEGIEGEEKQEGGSSSKAAEEVKVEKIEDRTARIAAFAKASHNFTEEELQWFTDATILR